MRPADNSGARIVEGYASLFGIADEGGDIVRAGAFRRSLRRRGAGRVRMLWQHDPARPVGVWDEIREDARGLYVRGRLVPGVAQAEDALRLIASGALDGLSIGFRARRAVRDPRSGLRRLYEIDLWEISLVTFPQQDLARLTKAHPARRFSPAVSLEHGGGSAGNAPHCKKA